MFIVSRGKYRLQISLVCPRSGLKVKVDHIPSIASRLEKSVAANAPALFLSGL
jgi:hypothetical protein